MSLWRSSVAAQEGHGVGGWRVGCGGVDGEGETGFGAEVEALVGEFGVADDAVVEVLDASAVRANVVQVPAGAKLVAAGGQFLRPARGAVCRGGPCRQRCG